ncbi:MAG TPA: Sua5/YciO/YrdC/YwlC family protein, partial [Gemmatimonadota bacterium]|nr:Sua5/YciO/YrdC/YwlC family protein [Gemmatimonadota bacterium]
AVVEAGRIAVRPASEVVSAALLAAWGAPLFSTSANPRGAPPAPGVAEAARAFGEGAEPALGILESEGGAAYGGTPSSVVDVTGPRPRLVREGAVARESLARVCPALE